MEERKENYLSGDQWEKKIESVIGHITVFEYGKLYAPVLHRRTAKTWGTDMSKIGSEVMDRPKLISKIHHLLHIHRSQRKRNLLHNSKCSSKLHRALQKVIRLCLVQNIGESQLYPVGNLFLELFECSGNSTAIFSILLDGMTVTHCASRDFTILYPTESSREENKEAFEYYLKHLCHCDRTAHGSLTADFLNQEIEPFTCMSPLSAAVQKRDPEIILILLRYGADPFLALGDPLFDERVRDPTEQLVDDLNGLYLFKNTGFNEETKSKLAEEEIKVLKCLNYIRRSVKRIPLTSSNHIVTSVEQDDSSEIQTDDEKSVEKAYNLHPQILENFQASHLNGLASLQQLCRCAVRATLQSRQSNSMFSIPKCISFLPLPNQLKNYLDLQYD